MPLIAGPLPSTAYNVTAYNVPPLCSLRCMKQDGLIAELHRACARPSNMVNLVAVYTEKHRALLTFTATTGLSGSVLDVAAMVPRVPLAASCRVLVSFSTNDDDSSA